MRGVEVWEPTHEEKHDLFEVYWMGREEARQGLPLRAGHNLNTAEQRCYREGWTTKHTDMLLEALGRSNPA